MRNPMDRSQVLIASHDKAFLRNLATSILLNHEVIARTDGDSTLEALLLEMPAAALLDSELPGLPTGELLKRLRRSLTQSRPTIVLFGRRGDPLLRAMITHGMADGMIELPCTDGAFLERFWKILDSRLRVSWQDLNEVQRALLEAGSGCIERMAASVASGAPVDVSVVDAFCQSLVAAGRSSDLLGMLGTLKAHHDYTFVHAMKVAGTLVTFGLALGIRDLDLIQMAQAGLVHDIGKIAISTDILYKTGTLSEAEERYLRRHPDLSVEVLRRSEEFSEDVLAVAVRHHERLDGSGYPRGLRGSQIDDLSLVAAIVDTFADLTQGTPTRQAMAPEAALSALRQMTPKQLEPAYFERFEEVVGAGLVP
jgi:HD-GYP domain-containing protein (c-di-GMP phosphodiesterase class II)